MNAPPPILRAKLDRFLHEGFCSSGTASPISATRTPGRGGRFTTWRDALEVIPTLFHRWDEAGWSTDSGTFVREVVEDLAVRVPHLGERFRMLLDMPDEEYAAFYLRDSACEPAPPAARAA